MRSPSRLSRLIGLTTIVSFATCLTSPLFAKKNDTYWLYVGTYTARDSQGIYYFEWNPSQGKLTPMGLAAPAKNPSFLTISPNGKNLYAVSELTDYQKRPAGAVSAYAIDPYFGRLQFLNQQSSEGGAPCHIITDRKGRHVLVANYVGGSAAVLPIAPNGSLQSVSSLKQHEGSSVNKARQEAPHAHSINLDSRNRFAAVADLGLDKVFVYRFSEEDGRLSAAPYPSVNLPAGSGPRHFAFHPSDKFAYVINEMKCTVSALSYDRIDGKLEVLQTLSTLPEGVQREDYSTAEVVVHPNGRFLYGSNRTHDSIAAFRIDPKTGRLTYLENEASGGRVPRNFAIDPTGQFLLVANHESDNLVVLKIDQKTGELSSTGIVEKVPMGVCLRFLKRK